MIIPKYLALSTTVTAVGGSPSALWKCTSSELWMRISSHFPLFNLRLNCAATSSIVCRIRVTVLAVRPTTKVSSAYASCERGVLALCTQGM